MSSVFIYLDLLSWQCPYLFYLSQCMLICHLRQYSVPSPVQVDFLCFVRSDPVLFTERSTVRSSLARSVTACTDIQQFELDLNAQSTDLLAELTDLSFGALQERNRIGGIQRETNEGSRGRSEEMQQLGDSGKGNEWVCESRFISCFLHEQHNTGHKEGIWWMESCFFFPFRTMLTTGGRWDVIN